MSLNGWAADESEYTGMSFQRPDPRYAADDRRRDLAQAAAKKKAPPVDKNEGWAADDSNWPAAHHGVGR